ncbi:ABC transporter permease [Anaerobacillus isosaccharinicus]|uniref:ABC transporter permease n=1 Tax=Anaerobacillus isosaccharinicus TaxID=1532552 RepID=A0A1S2LEW0_9BACI|nr:ABC transporter permease [Anaerobacillus isosaccharinicus]MBA5586768.1 ABC transporter permease [Anaerobacillus isosaccharinicus]QOY35014.1 ABC transporter permease [Anaerobacillus isosaccharinicus]
MISLIQNELLKLISKKKLIVITLIIATLISLFTYAQFKEAERMADRYNTTDWRTTLELQIADTRNRLDGNRITSEEWRQQLEIRIQQQQYYLDHDINPLEPGAPTFVRRFLESSVSLLLPLLIMIIAADLVSSEFSLGTVKLLLTRPVKRWKVLLSKYITLVLTVSLTVFIFGVLSYLISGLVFGYQGWSAPILLGFQTDGGVLNVTNVTLLPQWQYLLMAFGLAWFVTLVVGTLSFMLSVLVKSTAAGMGIMLSCLISGTILSSMVSSWESAKYFFMVNLNLIHYLSGSAPPIEGMSLLFSFTILLLWGIAALVISFTTFVRRDVF